MTPKEKARQLVDLFEQRADSFGIATSHDYDTECAALVVQEILNETFSNQDYWKFVLTEIEKL